MKNLITNPRATVCPALVMLGSMTLLTAHADRNTLDETKTRAALPLDDAPVIDGFIDDLEWGRAEGATRWWRMESNLDVEDELRGGDVVSGDPPFDSFDLSADMFVGYDSENLYVGVRVRDLDLSNDDAAEDSSNGDTDLDDGVELYIDGDNSNFPTEDTTGTNPEIVATGGQFVITANNARRETEAGNPGFGESAAWFAVAEESGDGYDVEFRISLETIGNPKPGDVIGLTIAVNDDDDGGPAERKIIWTGTAHTEATYGNVRLGTKSHQAPKVESAPEIDGDITPEEYGNGKEIVVTPHTGLYDVSAGDDDFETSDHSFSAWVTHDDEAVYVAVDVTDDKIINDNTGGGEEDGQTWNDDSVEIFFDADESDLDGRPQDPEQVFDGQYVFTANGAWRDNEANNPQFGANEDWFAAAKATGKGYAIEFKVMKSALPLPEQNAPLGFNICINDDDLGGNRKAQLNWSGRPHNEFSYGTLLLTDEVVGGDPGGLRFTDVTFDTITGSVTVVWDSKSGRTYIIERSPDLENWQELDDGWDSGGDSTTYTDNAVPAEAAKLYYRVTES